MANIVIENLKVKFQEKNGSIITAIDDISTTFKHGTFSTVLGYSGGGKTTLLRSIIGSVLINGKIYINGVDSEKMSIGEKNISYVSQDFALYPHLTVFENIGFPLTSIYVENEEVKKRVFEISEKMGIKDILNRHPKEISIGQKQRVALARALIKRSDIYLFDEPFSNIDKVKAVELKRFVKEILKQYDSTAIYVTHDVSDVFLLADHIYIIEEGKIVFEGTLDELQNSHDDLLKPYYELEDSATWKK